MEMTPQSLEEETRAPAAYERGVPLADVGKGTLLRFLPASVASMAGVAVALDIDLSLDGLAVAGGILGFAGLMALGFGGGLIALHRRLYPDAEIAGRRSVVAGVLSPLALFIVAVLSPVLGEPTMLGALVLVGMVLAVGMFFAWLTPTPKKMRISHGKDSGPDPESVSPGPAS